MEKLSEKEESLKEKLETRITLPNEEELIRQIDVKSGSTNSLIIQVNSNKNKR